MEGMAKFVEEGFHLAVRKQRRLCGRWFGEIGHDGHVRTATFSLFQIISHPCAALFRRSWEEIGVEHSQE